MSATPDDRAPTDGSGAPAGTSAGAPALRAVLICRDDLPSAQAVNAAAVLGISLGHLTPGAIGHEVVDGAERVLAGITTLPVPVLVAPGAELFRLLESATTTDGVEVLAITETARRARTYEEYATATAVTTTGAEDIVALVVHGRRNRVTKLTKHLPLM